LVKAESSIKSMLGNLILRWKQFSFWWKRYEKRGTWSVLFNFYLKPAAAGRKVSSKKERF